jgi:hypothetical protein
MIFRLPLLRPFSSPPTFDIRPLFLCQPSPPSITFSNPATHPTSQVFYKQNGPCNGTAHQSAMSRHPSPDPFHRVPPHACPVPHPCPLPTFGHLSFCTPVRATLSCSNERPRNLSQETSRLVLHCECSLLTKMPPLSLSFCRYLHWANTRCTRLGLGDPSDLCVLSTSYSDAPRHAYGTTF